MAEFGCLDYTPIFYTTSPLAIHDPMKGFLNLDPSNLLLKSLFAHLPLLIILPLQPSRCFEFSSSSNTSWLSCAHLFLCLWL